MSVARCRSRAAAGFTMVELVVVLVLTGILSAVMAPKIFGPSAFDEYGYRAELASAIGHARKAAIAGRRYSCVAIVDGEATFTRLVTEPESVGASIVCADNLGMPKGRSSCTGNPSHRICPPSSVAVDPAVLPVSWIFDPLGRPINSDKTAVAANIVIPVTHQPDIVVEAETGYVH